MFQRQHGNTSVQRGPRSPPPLSPRCAPAVEQSLGVRTDPVIFVVGEEEGAGGGRERRVLVEEGAPGERPVEEGLAVQGRQELAVFPLLSWYHASWDSEPNLPPGVLCNMHDLL